MAMCVSMFKKLCNLWRFFKKAPEELCPDYLDILAIARGEGLEGLTREELKELMEKIWDIQNILKDHIEDLDKCWMAIDDKLMDMPEEEEDE